jgi:hypothetical protein
VRIKMPADLIFDRESLKGKLDPIAEKKNELIQSSNTELARLHLLKDGSDVTKNLIKTEESKIKLMYAIDEVIQVMEASFIPKMNFLAAVLSSLETVDWLSDAEKSNLSLFNNLLTDLIEAAGQLNLTDIINKPGEDTSIYTMTKKLSDKINSSESQQYFQSISMLSAILSNITAIESKHSEDFSRFFNKKEKELTQSPHNYIVVKGGSPNQYSTMPMQIVMRYGLLYDTVLKHTMSAVTDTPQTREEEETLTSVTKACAFCKEKAKKANILEQCYKRGTESINTKLERGSKEVMKMPIRTNYAPIITSVAIGIALGVGLAFGLLALGAFPPLGLGILALTLITASYYGGIGGALGAILPKIIKKEAPTSIAQTVPPTQTATSQRKKIDVNSITRTNQNVSEAVDQRVKPTGTNKAFFEDRSRVGSGDEQSLSSGMEPSPTQSATPINESDDEIESIDSISVKPNQ